MTLEHLFNQQCLEFFDVQELVFLVLVVVQQVPVGGDSHHQEHCQIDQQIVGVTVDRAVKCEMHKTGELVSEGEGVIE